MLAQLGGNAKQRCKASTCGGCCEPDTGLPCPAAPRIQANEHQWDFAENWLQHVANAGISYAVVAASDVATSGRLAARGQACFEWIDEEIPRLGLTWGEEGWRRMTWSKVGSQGDGEGDSMQHA